MGKWAVEGLFITEGSKDRSRREERCQVDKLNTSPQDLVPASGGEDQRGLYGEGIGYKLFVLLKIIFENYSKLPSPIEALLKIHGNICFQNFLKIGKMKLKIKIIYSTKKPDV